MSKQDVINYVMETPHNTNRAVLEGLVDTAVEESQVQSDWDQNDETAKDYIKNRICYEETGEDKTYTLTPNRDNDTWNFTNGDIPLILGQSATVKSFGGISSTFVGTVTQDSDGKLCIDATSVIPITIYSNTATYISQWVSNTGTDYVTVTISSTVVHQIDPKFIPIASPDWNQNDPTAKDYVKNRICYYNSVSISTAIHSSSIYFTNRLTNEDLNTFSDWCTGASPVSLKINNTVYTLQPGGFADGIYTLNYNNTAAITRNIRSTADYLGIEDGFPVEKTAGLSFTLYVEEIKQIDKKYIPDELFTQADWNQNDTSASDYIKNKPTIDTTLSSTSENAVQNKVVKAAIDEVLNMVEEYIGSKVSDKELILFSSTENSTKKFKITVNDSGTISAKEVTEGA